MIGTGYVGLVSGACLADFGHQVTCVDKDAGKIASLRRGEIPIFEPGLDALVAANVKAGRLDFATDLAAPVAEADAVFIEELQKSGEYEKIWQAFAALLPVKVVGVMGNGRTYEYVIALRAVDSIDGMSADWHKIPNELLEKISSTIIGKVRGVNRVLYDITQKPPATIEYE